MDELNMWGKTKDLHHYRAGQFQSWTMATDVLKSHGRTVQPDPEPEVGSFYRSDHFEFAKEGVPALDPDSGTDFIGKPVGYGKQKMDYYTAHDYHKPSDEVKPDGIFRAPWTIFEYWQRSVTGWLRVSPIRSGNLVLSSRRSGIRSCKSELKWCGSHGNPRRILHNGQVRDAPPPGSPPAS